MRNILGTATDSELGFFKQRTRQSDNRPREVVALDAPVAGRESAQVGAIEAVLVPAGRSFAGLEVAAHHYTAERAAQEWLMVKPDANLTASLRRPDHRSMVIAVDREQNYYISDGRRFAGRTDRRTGPQPLPSGNLLDDLTIGIVWAVTNTDTALLADDALLEASQARLAYHEQRLTSEVALNEVPHLHAVSSRWLGSRFCARHVTRHIHLLDGARSSGPQNNAVRKPHPGSSRRTNMTFSDGPPGRSQVCVVASVSQRTKSRHPRGTSGWSCYSRWP
ncbi:hypothetical protein ACWF0M_12660 [Kribbella sp. NPDC055110]